MSQLSTLPIYLDDSASITITEIRSRARRLKASSNGLGIIFIDYLQLVRPGQLSKGANRNDEIADICRSLKATAKDLAVPIVALAQLNRAVEARQDKRPMLSDLRDSGSIEQEADIVAFIYRDEYYNKETADPGVTELILAKHRNGRTGTVKMMFQPEFTKFVAYADAGRYAAP
jgi:replicative DNA helicase